MIFPKQESSKKGHAHFYADSCDSPDFGKTFFPETRNPQKGTSMCAKAAERQSLNRENLFPGNKKPRFWDIRWPDLFCCTPQKQQNLFPENKKPRFEDIHASISGGLVHIFASCVFYALFQLKIMTAYMLSRTCLQKSSANYLVPRVFAQKGFAISIFGHFFCPFPENFIESCRVKTKNNKIKLQDLL